MTVVAASVIVAGVVVATGVVVIGIVVVVVAVAEVGIVTVTGIGIGRVVVPLTWMGTLEHLVWVRVRRWGAGCETVSVLAVGRTRSVEADCCQPSECWGTCESAQTVNYV